MPCENCKKLESEVALLRKVEKACRPWMNGYWDAQEYAAAKRKTKEALSRLDDLRGKEGVV